MDALVKAYRELNGYVKALMYTGALIAALTGAYSTGKAIISVPEKLDEHMLDQKHMNETLDKMLCIQVADHMKLNWVLCYTDPTRVNPNGTH